MQLTIAPETGAKVTGSSPTFKIRKWSAKSTQKGGMGCFSVAATFARKEPCLDLFRVIVECGKTTNTNVAAEELDAQAPRIMPRVTPRRPKSRP
ncbi:hypothetical protein PIB30_088663, partial [Stylosanthes scabra]|nr:hypothetical protein [Stylosanthes scabra]